MDSSDAISIDSLDVVETEKKKNRKKIKKEKKMSIIKLKDNVEFEVNEKVEDEFCRLKKDIAELKNIIEEKDNKISELSAKKDSFEDENKTLKEEMKNLKDEIPNQIKKAIKDRIALVDVAVKHEIEIKDDMDDFDIQKEIILKAFPKADLENKDEKYIEARFDSAVEILAEKNNVQNKTTVLDPDIMKKDEKKIDSDELRKRHMKNAWKLNSDQSQKYRKGIIDDDMKTILEEEV
jgi:hypothetical protein